MACAQSHQFRKALLLLPHLNPHSPPPNKSLNRHIPILIARPRRNNTSTSRPNPRNQPIPHLLQTRLKLLPRTRKPIRARPRNRVLTRERNIQNIMLRVSRISINPLIREAHLSEAQTRLTGNLPAVDIPPDAVEELVAADDGDDGQGLHAVFLGVEGCAAVAFVGGVVVAEDDEGVDVGV